MVTSELPPAPTAAAPSLRSSQPLQEISPNSSPRKTTQGPILDGAEEMPSKTNYLENSRSRTMSPVKSASPLASAPGLSRATSNAGAHPPARPRHGLTADLADLLNTSVASRPGSAAGPGPPQKRKARPLGRAPSGISNRSASVQSERQSPALPSDIVDSAADGFGTSREAPMPPSTQLGYETPEAEAHRQQMSKKMGTKLQDDSGLRRLASLGTVKDSSLSGDPAVGNRVRGRHKTK